MRPQLYKTTLRTLKGDNVRGGGSLTSRKAMSDKDKFRRPDLLAAVA